MARGDKEARCFKIVRKAMFNSQDGFPQVNFMTGKNYATATDAEFEDDYRSYLSYECQKNFFGLLEDDRLEFAKAIRSAGLNPAANDFPDLLFPNGFIEHFQITSSKSSKRKGSSQEQLSGKVRREECTQQKEWEKGEAFTGTRSKRWVVESAEHSYKYLVNSFKRSWEDHIESLKNYGGCKNIGIFMIEYPDMALSMYEQKYGDWIDGMSQGDFRDAERHRCYRLSRDKQLLKYIYGYRDQLKYVIFVYQDHFEVIKLDSIPQLLKLMPWDFGIYPLIQQTTCTLHQIRLGYNPY